MKADKYAYLRSMCRGYLNKLRYIAKKRGLGRWVDEMIHATNRDDCMPSEYEVNMLARACDDERINRLDIPKMFGKSYRECVEDDDFKKVKKLRRVGVYSKVSAILQSKTIKNGKRRS